MRMESCDFCKNDSSSIPKGLSQAPDWRMVRVILDNGAQSQFDCCPACAEKLGLPENQFTKAGDELYSLLEDTVIELIEQHNQP